MLKNYLKIAWKVLLRQKLYTGVILFNIVLTLTILNILLSFVNHFWGNNTVQIKFDKVLAIQDIRLTKNGSYNNFRSSLSSDFIKKYIKPMKTPQKIAFSSMVFIDNNIFLYKKEKRHKFKIRYCDSEYWNVLSFSFIEGRPFNINDVDNNDLIAVIDKRTRDIYFDGEQCVGKYIQIRNIAHKIIAVVENVDYLKLAGFANIWLPYTHAKHMKTNYFGGPFEVYFLANKKSDFENIQQELAEKIKKIDFPDPEKFDRIEVSADPFFYDLLKQVFGNSKSVDRILSNLTIIFITIFFLLPVFNLININTNRIYERGAEIGIRKSFGANIAVITKQFIVENVFVTTLGLFISILLSFLILAILNSADLIPNAKLSLSFTVLYKSFICSLLMGVFSSVFPAYKIAKLNIVNSLNID